MQCSENRELRGAVLLLMTVLLSSLFGALQLALFLNLRDFRGITTAEQAAEENRSGFSSTGELRGNKTTVFNAHPYKRKSFQQGKPQEAGPVSSPALPASRHVTELEIPAEKRQYQPDAISLRTAVNWSGLIPHYRFRPICFPPISDWSLLASILPRTKNC